MDYILDVLAETFPEKAKLVSCACGGKETALAVTGADGADSLLSKRDLIEKTLFDTYQSTIKETKASSFEALLDQLSDNEIRLLLVRMPLETIDLHLRDLALFLSPTRLTTLNEIKDWDSRHRNDFTKKEIKNFI